MRAAMADPEGRPALPSPGILAVGVMPAYILFVEKEVRDPLKVL